jgi:hypothetical protein
MQQIGFKSICTYETRIKFANGAHKMLKMALLLTERG